MKLPNHKHPNLLGLCDCDHPEERWPRYDPTDIRDAIFSTFFFLLFLFLIAILGHLAFSELYGG